MVDSIPSVPEAGKIFPEREEAVIETINSGADFYHQKGGQPKEE